MELEKILNNFQLTTEERELIKCGDLIKDFKNRETKHLQKYVPESFKNIARALLGGYFEVQVGGNIVRKIYPSCVELYYHEESGTDAIKDYIVYHRNRPKTFNAQPSLFKHSVINAHQSGVDIAFEHERIINNDNVQVRASALIRGFRVEVLDPEYDVDTVDIDVSKVDGRSTYFYNALFSNLPIIEGFSIRWVDGTERNDELTMNFIQNVLPFEASRKDSRKVDEKGIMNDGRCWQFRY